MVQRAAFLHRHTDHGALGPLGRLADRFRDFTRLARPVADAALLVTDHHEGGEGKTPATLHHLGDAVDGHQFVDQLVAAIAIAIVTAVAAPAVRPSRASRAMILISLRTPARLRGRLRPARLNAAVIQVRATVEHDGLVTPAATARSATSLPTAVAASLSEPVFSAVAKILRIEAGGGRKRAALRVVDDLGVDMLARAKHRQTWAPRRSCCATDSAAVRAGAAVGSPVIAHHYFFLPSLRRMVSSVVACTPLPL